MNSSLHLEWLPVNGNQIADIPAFPEQLYMGTVNEKQLKLFATQSK